ncbi:SDR family NAD(P)-dependent oxidoreductase [Microbacterium sp. X-17]|uniref:SDR family NAD(P)-dependent oxidoreductase n=1 Tax=Microbacterium sp. X-17 TaxID=3144404 RepID=UPI0031F4C40D
MVRRVAITGAGSGIGLAVARAFAAAGDEVFIGDISEERLEATKATIPTATISRLDVTDFDQMSAFGVTAAGTQGLDVFINNAGVFDAYASITETTVDLWQRIIGVNLTGYFHGCKVAAQLMLPNKRGRIINVGSVAGQRGAADGLSYSASKAGIEGMTRRLAIDLGPAGITANVVAPGVTATDIRKNSGEQLGGMLDMNRGIGASPELWDFLIPARRGGTADEVAAVIEFLASEKASYVTGQVIHVDGGWSAT